MSYELEPPVDFPDVDLQAKNEHLDYLYEQIPDDHESKEKIKKKISWYKEHAEDETNEVKDAYDHLVVTLEEIINSKKGGKKSRKSRKTTKKSKKSRKTTKKSKKSRKRKTLKKRKKSRK